MNKTAQWCSHGSLYIRGVPSASIILLKESVKYYTGEATQSIHSYHLRVEAKIGAHSNSDLAANLFMSSYYLHNSYVNLGCSINLQWTRNRHKFSSIFMMLSCLECQHWPHNNCASACTGWRTRPPTPAPLPTTHHTHSLYFRFRWYIPSLMT